MTGRRADTSDASRSEPSQVDSPPNATASDEDAGRAGRYRVLLLAPGGPLLFELTLKIGGKALETRHADLLVRYRRDADRDGDGRVTWDELLANDAIRATFLADAQLNSDRERVEFLRSYDLNGNREVDDSEWPRIFRQTTTKGRPFAVFNRDDDREWNREQSPLFAVLDSDENQRLDAEECRRAPARLRQLDADDDERLERAEALASRVETAGSAVPATRRSLEPAIAWEISPRTDWNLLLSTLQSVYSGGGPLASGCFPARPELFTALDKDGNRRLARRELELLTESPPAARWSIDWPDENLAMSSVVPASESTTAPQAAPQAPPEAVARSRPGVLELTAFTGSGGASPTAPPQRLGDVWRISAGSMDFAVFPRNLPGPNSDSTRVRLVAGFPPDALWTVADADGDGQMLGGEFEELGSRLMALDRDNSGDVTRDELPELVWLAVVRGQTPAGAIGPPSSQTSPSAMAFASPSPPPSDPTQTPGTAAAGGSASSVPVAIPDWFESLDANGDGRISQREFPGEPTLFKRLDKNADGQLTVEEADQRP